MPNKKADAVLAKIPEPRRSALGAVRREILRRLPKGYEEDVLGAFISYQVPLETYPDTYNKRPLMYAALGNQKNYMTLHLPAAYADLELRKKLETGFKAAQKKLDMGKGCLRFKALDDLPLEVIGKCIGAVPMKAYVAAAKEAHSPAARAKRRAERAKQG